MLMIECKSESDVGEKELVARRMIDYVQAVIVSCPYKGDRRKESSEEEEWSALSKAIEDIFQKVTVKFNKVSLARKIVAGETIDESFEDLYYEAQSYWCNMRGR